MANKPDIVGGQYRQIYSSWWEDEAMRGLTDQAARALVVLRTNAASTPEGIMLANWSLLCHQVPSLRFEKLTELVVELGQWLATDMVVVWIYNALRYSPHHDLRSDTTRQGIIFRVMSLPRSYLVPAFLNYYGLTHHANGKLLAKYPTPPQGWQVPNSTAAKHPEPPPPGRPGRKPAVHYQVEAMEKLEALCQRIAATYARNEFNPYAFVEKMIRVAGYLPPPQVFIATLGRLAERKAKPRNPYGYCEAIYNEELPKAMETESAEEAQRFKNAGLAPLSEIMAKLAKGGSDDQ